MEKKYFEDFLKIFMHLNNAGLIIAGDFYKPREVSEINEIDKTINQISNDPALIKNVSDEIEKNLYHKSREDREIYIRDVLKNFSSISPYLKYNVDREYIREHGKQKVKINNQIYPISVDAAHKTIIKYEAWLTPHLDDPILTVLEKYIILCFRTFRDFFNKLNALCLNFNLDLMEIQRQSSLNIWKRDSIVNSDSEQKEISTMRSGALVDRKKDKDQTIREKVENAFGWMQRLDSRRHKIIMKGLDFNQFVDWVTFYFDNNFKVPEIDQPIQKINTNKGNVVYAFKEFFTQEYPTHTRPDSLYELIKTCFEEYRFDKLENLKKMKEPQYYNQLIKKNN